MRSTELRNKIIEQTPSLAVGYGMRIPESVVALKAMTMFWSERMDRDYKPPTEEDRRLTEKYYLRAEKVRRGRIWRIAHSVLEGLDLTKSKQNLKNVYREIEGK